MQLRKLSIKDVNGILEWMHAPNVNQYFRFNGLTMTEEKVKVFIDNSFTDENKHYAIVDDDDIYQGTISLKHINYEDRNAEYAISLRERAKGKGIATEATDKLLYIAFEELGLVKVYLNVLSLNKRAVRFYEKYGFRHVGKSEKHVKIQGKFHDLEWYEIFKEDIK